MNLPPKMPNNVPPKMPGQMPPRMPRNSSLGKLKDKDLTLILVIALAIASIVASGCIGNLGLISIIPIALVNAAIAIGWKDFKMEKGWIVALTLVTLALGLCIYMISSGVRLKIEEKKMEQYYYNNYYPYEDYFYDGDYFDEFDDIFERFQY